jgi:hypothetical protein
MRKSLKRIFEEIEQENTRSNEIYGGPVHDDAHDLQEWQRFMMPYIGNICKEHVTDEYFRENMLKIANLAVAAIESLDRKNPEAYEIMYS